jgi:membrane protease YdiL (CAAX protease family)
MSNDTSKEKDLSSEALVKSNKWVWGPFSVTLVVVFNYFFAQLLGGLLVSFYPYIRGWGTTQSNNWINTPFAQFVFVLISEALTVFVIWLFIRRRIAFKLLGLVKPRWRDLIYVVMGVVAYYILYAIVLSVVSSFVKINVNQQQNLGLNNSSVVGTSALILTFISLVILPPIAEEIEFRGLLYGGLRQRLKPFWAILFTSSLFAAPHLLESNSGQGLLWIAGIDTFVLSTVLCFIREKTGSIWPGIGVHAAKNGIAFISLFIVHVH